MLSEWIKELSTSPTEDSVGSRSQDMNRGLFLYSCQYQRVSVNSEAGGNFPI